MVVVKYMARTRGDRTKACLIGVAQLITHDTDTELSQGWSYLPTFVTLSNAAELLTANRCRFLVPASPTSGSGDKVM